MGEGPYRARLLDFLGLREELARRCPDAEWFDLRFRDRVIAHRPGRWPEPAPVTRADSEIPAAPREVEPPAPPALPAQGPPPPKPVERGVTTTPPAQGVSTLG
jgi:hypothetical protein